jgi:hypothetical protein
MWTNNENCHQSTILKIGRKSIVVMNIMVWDKWRKKRKTTHAKIHPYNTIDPMSRVFRSVFRQLGFISGGFLARNSNLILSAAPTQTIETCTVTAAEGVEMDIHQSAA